MDDSRKIPEGFDPEVQQKWVELEREKVRLDKKMELIEAVCDQFSEVVPVLFSQMLNESKSTDEEMVKLSRADYEKLANGVSTTPEDGSEEQPSPAKEMVDDLHETSDEISDEIGGETVVDETEETNEEVSADAV